MVTIQTLRGEFKAITEIYEVRQRIVNRINAIQQNILMKMPIEYKINAIKSEGIENRICAIDDMLLGNLTRQLEILSEKYEKVSKDIDLFYDFLEQVDVKDAEVLLHIVVDNRSLNDIANITGNSLSTVKRHCKKLETDFSDMQGDCENDNI